MTIANKLKYLRLLMFFMAVIFCTGCRYPFGLGKDRTFLLQDGTYAGKYYEIKRFNSGCCGCLAFYYNIYDNNSKNKLREAQFVYEVVCGTGEPTRFNFRQTEASGLTMGAYILVNDSTYVTPLGELDKLLMIKLDSIMGPVHHHAKHKFSEFKGWRNPAPGERLHPFTISK